MSGEQLRLLPEYDGCFRPGKYLTYVLKLQPPFISKYLYIQTNEQGQPDALHFISEEQERERRKANAESERQN